MHTLLDSLVIFSGGFFIPFNRNLCVDLTCFQKVSWQKVSLAVPVNWLSLLKLFGLVCPKRFQWSTMQCTASSKFRPELMAVLGTERQGFFLVEPLHTPHIQPHTTTITTLHFYYYCYYSKLQHKTSFFPWSNYNFVCSKIFPVYMHSCMHACVCARVEYMQRLIHDKTTLQTTTNHIIVILLCDDKYIRWLNNNI